MFTIYKFIEGYKFQHIPTCLATNGLFDQNVRSILIASYSAVWSTSLEKESKAYEITIVCLSVCVPGYCFWSN